MGQFYIIFSLFKFLKYSDFRKAFQQYDIIAARIPWYSALYPFLELGLGAANIIGKRMIIWNSITIALMSISSVGVWKSLRTNTPLVCACLGTFFKLPMTTVTLLENLVMLVMAVICLIRSFMF
jgi:hypothetical protein